MKIALPEGLKGKELFSYLVANKSALIAKKKSLPITSDAIAVAPTFVTPTKSNATKADGSEAISLNDGSFRVKVVANTAWWCDSQMDVLTDTCWDKSIKEKGINIPHIADHQHKSTAHVGDVKAVYPSQLPLSELGLNEVGFTTALIFETDIRKDYNELVYKFYKNGKINQHSIGLQYVSLGMAINDEEFLGEYTLWQKYIDKVLNKQKAIDAGYFFIVTEIKVLENSCVLFGANELTPTLEIQTLENSTIHNNNKSAEDTALQPVLTTGTQPLQKGDGLNIQSPLNVFQNEPEPTIKNRWAFR